MKSETVPLSTKISKEADTILHTIYFFDQDWSKREIIEKSMDLFKEWYGQEKLKECSGIHQRTKPVAIDLRKSTPKRIVLLDSPTRMNR